jgi:4-amino-4-deoxy-L-arabinose transferase-like glycosyltransferase
VTAAVLLIAGLFSLGAVVGARTRYFPALNDFWPLLFQSNTLAWGEWDTFRNGFFPPGYAVFLWLLGGDQILKTAFLANVVFGCATVLVVYLACSRFTSEATAWACAACAALQPLVFASMLTTGPDAGCMFFAVGAVLLLAHSLEGSEALRRRGSWMAGALWGIATLWRYHYVAFAACALAAAAIVWRRRDVGRAVAAWSVSLAILAALSLLPGFSEQVARAQAFNVYKTIVPVDWYHLPSDVPASVVGVIRRDPAAFAGAALRFAAPHLWLLVPCTLGAVMMRASSRRFAVAVLLLQLSYLPVVSAGGSPRGILPLVPPALLCGALVVEAALAVVKTAALRRAAASAVVLVVGTLVVARWAPQDRAFIEASIAGYEWRRAVERELRAQGVTTPTQVFGDAGFHFVTGSGSGWYAYVPRFNGGWPRLDLHGLDEMMPELSAESLDALVADCERLGVTHLVLSSSAGALMPDLGRLYEGRLAHPRLRLTASVAGMRIYRVQ